MSRRSRDAFFNETADQSFLKVGAQTETIGEMKFNRNAVSIVLSSEGGERLVAFVTEINVSCDVSLVIGAHGSRDFKRFHSAPRYVVPESD